MVAGSYPPLTKPRLLGTSPTHSSLHLNLRKGKGASHPFRHSVRALKALTAQHVTSGNETMTVYGQDEIETAALLIMINSLDLSYKSHGVYIGVDRGFLKQGKRDVT